MRDREVVEEDRTSSAFCGGKRPDCHTLVTESSAGMQERMTVPSACSDSAAEGSSHILSPVTACTR